MIEKIKRMVEKGNQCMVNWFTPKRVAICLTIGYVVSLIPLFWIGKYNFPSADDYTNGSRCYHVWEAEHSVFEVLKEAFSRTIDEWLTWRGCYTSSFFSSLPPSIFGERLYFLTTIIVLLMLTFATIFLFYEILVKGFGADRHASHSISMITLFIMVQCMGVSGRAESFYWYSGAINYTFTHGVLLFFYGTLVSAAVTDGKGKNIRLLLASILGFFAAGGNQMTMLNGAVVLAVLTAFLVIFKKWKAYGKLWIPIMCFYIGFIMAVAAPGNFIRADASIGMNPVKAVFVSFYYCLDLMIDQWTTWSVMILIISMVPFFWYMAGMIKFQFPCPYWVTVFGFCLVSAMATPPLFAVGNIEAGRLQGLMFLMYVPVLVLCVGYVTGWLRRRWERKQPDKGKGSREKKGFLGIHGCQWFAGCMVFFLFGSLILTIPEPCYYTVTSAITDIKDGSAKEYEKTLEERVRLYRSGEGKALVVEPLLKHPQLLFFSDIEKDPQDWKNRGICRYYGLDSVMVGERDTGN